MSKTRKKKPPDDRRTATATPQRGALFGLDCIRKIVCWLPESKRASLLLFLTVGSIEEINRPTIVPPPHPVIRIMRITDEGPVVHEEDHGEGLQRVQRLTAELVDAVRSVEANANEQQRCIDQLRPVQEENNALKAEVARLRAQLVDAEHRRTQLQNNMKADQDELRAVLERTVKEKNEQAEQLRTVKHDLKVTRENVQAQFKELQWRLGFNIKKAEVLERYFTPLLDLFEGSDQDIRAASRPPRPDVICHRARWAWANMSRFCRENAIGVCQYALSLMKSHYPAADLERLAEGYPEGMDEARAEEIRNSMQQIAASITDDVDLVSGEGQSSRANE